MAQAFSPMPGDAGRIIGFLDDVERSVVIELLYQTSVLLSEGVRGARPNSESSAEDDLLASLAFDTEDVERPDDPALQRLLPDGVVGDDQAAAEFRRFTQNSLRSQKLANIDAAMEAFEQDFVDEDEAAALADGHYARQTEHQQAHDQAAATDGDTTREVILTVQQARAVMVALTDVRLVLASRLGVETDEDAEQLERSEEPLALYYDFLTWLADSVTVAVMECARQR